jgi:cytochrome P450
MNPPDHTRLRRLVSKAFTPRTVEKLRPDIVRITDGLLDQFTGTVDVIDDLARILPITVIGEMLGVPPSARADLLPLVRDLVRTIEPGASLDQLDAGERAREAIAEYFTALIAQRRLDPTDDLLSHLVHVEENDDRLSHAELVSTIALLFGAGFETTTNLIGNGLLALLDHPHQLQRLRDDRSLLATAVDELLRWDTPVQAAARTALEDVELHGVEVHAGDQMALLLGSANRDPRQFDDPDRLDIGRVGPPPMSFGAGIHHCLGAALARAEGQVVLDRLLGRFPLIEAAWGAERPRFTDSIILRGLETLPIRVA